MGSNHAGMVMIDIDSDYLEPPGVFRLIVGLTKQTGGSNVVLECKHVIPALPYRVYKVGDVHICNRCSAKAMADLVARKPDG